MGKEATITYPLREPRFPLNNAIKLFGNTLKFKSNLLRDDHVGLQLNKQSSKIFNTKKSNYCSMGSI
jgi:hypothetical protein